MNLDNDEKAKRYLLGKLTEEETSNVEREFFQNTSAFEDILIAENALTDAYVSGHLSTEDLKLFEKRLLINPRQRDRAAFAKTLVDYASRQSIEEPNVAEPVVSATSIFDRLFSFRPMLAYSLASAFVLFLIGGAIWLTLTDPGSFGSDQVAEVRSSEDIAANSPIEKQIPAVAKDETQAPDNNDLTANKIPENGQQNSPRKEQTSRPRSAAVVAALVLFPGSTRGDGSARHFTVPKHASTVNLELNFENGEYSTYHIVIETVDGQQLWSKKIQKPAAKKRETSVRTAVPANRLRSGDHIIALKGLSDDGIYEPVADYAVTIDRQ